MSSRVLAIAMALAVSGSLPLARAQAPAAPAGAAQAPSGEAVFRRACAGCHLGLAQIEGASAGHASALDAHAVPREFMRQFPPQAVLTALTSGKMQAQGAALSEGERRAVAEYVSGRSLTPQAQLRPEAEAGKACTDATPMSDPAHGPSWSSWGNGVTNTRFQDQKHGGLTAADLPRLTLKWAFGYVNVATARTQPALAGGRLFVASESGQVHALNPRSGCTYWTFTAQAGVASGLAVGHYRTSAGADGYAVFFGDRRAHAYAVDAQSGRQLWVRKLDEHRSAAITGSPTVYEGRVFVPVQGIGEEGLGAHNNYACCTFRGSVTALDASSGTVLWKTYTVAESRPRAKNAAGVQMYGPAGGGIWSAPTIDARRRLVYVATGNGYAEPMQPTTDAVLALDLDTGALKWSRQLLEGDIWAMGCEAKNPDNPACPGTLGPDFDFSAPPALVRAHGRELLVLPQKSGLAFALDPAKQGELVWQYRFGAGSGLGGEWGGASDGEHVYFGVGDLLAKKPGGLHAVNLADGQRLWALSPQPPLCGDSLGCNSGQGSAITLIPGAVLSGSVDGGLRAYSPRDGAVLWMFDTNRPFDTVNGVPAHGGAIDGPGPIVADGRLYGNSGAGGLVGPAGNVLHAFGLK